MAHWGAVAPKKKKQTNKIIFNYSFLKIFDKGAMAHGGWGVGGEGAVAPKTNKLIKLSLNTLFLKILMPNCLPWVLVRSI